MLIADSWFGSVACALALFKHGLFCVMNVKTAHKGFPKTELLEACSEIKGNTEEARAARRARRGVQRAYWRKFKVGSSQVTVLAAGHNKKVPLLLIATHGTMRAGTEHVKKWRTPTADGGERWHEIRTKQPQVHELYRTNMNGIDIHNKLRQGVVAMADVWRTRAWPERHFAEMLGFLEVNVYNTLTYFLPDTYKNITHTEFRKQLSWALLTLGQEAYPAASTSQDEPSVSCEIDDESSTSGRPSSHVYQAYGGKERHHCGYCGKEAYQFCVTCERAGYGQIAVCGRKSGRPCMDHHVAGKQIKHASWRLTKKRVCRATTPASVGSSSSAPAVTPRGGGESSSYHESASHVSHVSSEHVSGRLRKRSRAS